MRLVLLGPPGAGKGTQAAVLAKQLGVPHISTGDILRRSIELATPSGLEAKGYMDDGNLVPFELILRLVRDRLAEPDTQKGWILDGFPRNLDQEQAFSGLLQELKQQVDRVIYFHVDDLEVLKRLGGRRVCRQCGDTFHIEFSPPACQQPEACALEHIYQRNDDSEEAIRNRLQVYSAETQPLVDHYEQQSRLLTVDAAQDIGEVRAQLQRELGL